jgi:hypothetical protein
MNDELPAGQGDSDDSGPDGKSDCFAPPREPCECYCLHCNRIFMSDRIWLQKVINGRDGFDGFWMCPTPNCGGAGFTFDIFPTDPNHPANEGWHDSDEEEIFDEGEQSIDEYDPAEPKYAELEDELGEDEDDLEGEEWKHGLQPGERPPESDWQQEARQAWEQEQKKYDEPDQRPRVIDWSDRKDPPPPKSESEQSDGEIWDEDIPF